jgi:hypothetical protein
MNRSASLPIFGRMGWCLLPAAVGASAAIVLLAIFGGPGRVARAAPAALTYPGCAPTIQQCLDNASPGETLVIGAGTYITSLTLSKAVSLTGVNSATTILQALPGQRVLTVTGAGVDSSVVISGLTFTGGSALGGDCPTGCGGGVLITDGAQPLLSNLQLISNTAGWRAGGLYSDGEVTIADSLFEGNQCTLNFCLGGGLYAFRAIALKDSRFISNTSKGGGGGAIAEIAVTIVGGIFQNNSCAPCGGAGVAAGNVLVVTGTQFLNNTSESGGAAARVGITATISGALFQDNHCTTANCLGGALFIQQALTLKDTVFLSNTANGEGGAAAVTGDTTVAGGLFQGNQCTLTGCSGGALMVTGHVALNGTQFISNTSNATSGAVYAGGATVTRGRFIGNRCIETECVGGAIFVWGSVIVDGTQFIGNSADYGGALFHSLANAQIVNALFVGNTAIQMGGAMMLASFQHAEVIHTTITSPTLGSGAAIAIRSSDGPSLIGTVEITDTIITSYTVGVSVTWGIVREGHNLFFGVGSNLMGPITSTGGSLTGDPDFVNPDGGDYHLGSDSLAIDNGIYAIDAPDFEGDPRPLGSGFDIGMDEYLAQALYRVYFALVTAP